MIGRFCSGSYDKRITTSTIKAAGFSDLIIDKMEEVDNTWRLSEADASMVSDFVALGRLIGMALGIVV